MSVAVLLCELLAVGALYAGGVRRVRRWPAWRAACFGAGLLALAVALVGMDAIADASLTGHMAQHLVLVFVAAPLLVLGSPMALALRATGRAARHVTGARALAHPLLGWATLPLVMAASHFTGVYEAAIEHPAIHDLEHIAWLAAAIHFWRPVLGADPVPRRPGFAGRMLYLLLASGPMAIVGVAMGSSAHPWYRAYAGPHALADQHEAGALMWVGGGVALALVTIGVGWAALLREHNRRLAYEERTTT